MFLVRASQQLLAVRGLYAGAGGHLAEHLRQAGLTRVQERRVVPGATGRLERAQRLLVADLLAAYTSLQTVIVNAGILSEVEYSRALAQAKEELPQRGGLDADYLRLQHPFLRLTSQASRRCQPGTLVFFDGRWGTVYEEISAFESKVQSWGAGGKLVSPLATFLRSG